MDNIIEEIRKNRNDILEDIDFDLEKLTTFQKEGLNKLKSEGWNIISKKDVKSKKNNINAPSMAQ